MASEPKKPIEQMLEALAKARRAQFGDDPKMPNPMRVRLHEEIARAGAVEDEERESRPSWVTMFWPRLTVAAALATLLVLVPAIWWNQSQPGAGSGDLALRDRAAARAADELNPAVPAENTITKAPAVSASKPTVNLADNRQIKIEPAGKATAQAEALVSSTGVQQGRGATEFPSQETKGFDEIASAKVQAAPAAAPPVGADWKAKSDAMAAAAPPVAQPSASSLGTKQQFSQQFAVQSFRNNAQQVSGAANVLNAFQVEQEGNEIRVLDADGSTYTGKIEQLAKGAEGDSRTSSQRYDATKRTRKDATQAAGQNESGAPQSYFRATGFSVTLKRTLVFEGNYATAPTQQPAMSTSNDRERAESNSARARIVGTVRVNGEAPVAVDAIAETTEPATTKKSEK